MTGYSASSVVLFVILSIFLIVQVDDSKFVLHLDSTSKLASLEDTSKEHTLRNVRPYHKNTKDSIEYRQKTLEGFKREKFNKNAYLKMLIAKQLKQKKTDGKEMSRQLINEKTNCIQDQLIVKKSTLTNHPVIFHRKSEKEHGSDEENQSKQ
uniref:Uncharacterized protein n=1 Tax=Onchocerca volvulus TaxID=6282 RepID=A0A8R1U0M8_ONCVO